MDDNVFVLCELLGCRCADRMRQLSKTRLFQCLRVEIKITSITILFCHKSEKLQKDSVYTKEIELPILNSDCFMPVQSYV